MLFLSMSKNGISYFFNVSSVGISDGSPEIIGRITSIFSKSSTVMPPILPIRREFTILLNSVHLGRKAAIISWFGSVVLNEKIARLSSLKNISTIENLLLPDFCKPNPSRFKDFESNSIFIAFWKSLTISIGIILPPRRT